MRSSTKSSKRSSIILCWASSCCVWPTRPVTARAKFMELMAQVGGLGVAMSESAFITGVVSAMVAVLGMPMEQLVASLGLPEDVRGALLARKGVLGELLDLAQALEDENDAVVVSFIASHGNSGAETLNHAQGEALAWANQILLA